MADATSRIYDLAALARENWHVHTLASSCASPGATPARIAAAAEAAGLTTVALVDHHHCAAEDLPAMLARTREAVAAVSSPVRLIVGAELSAYGVGKYADSPEANRLADYRLYSCNHYMLPHWEHPPRRTARDYAEHMLAVLADLLPSGRADGIAHPFGVDYLREYLGDPQTATRAITDRELGDILELGRTHGVAWEINTRSCLSDEAFSRRYWRIGREVGVVFHLGTDAHRLSDVDPAEDLPKLRYALGILGG